MKRILFILFCMLLPLCSLAQDHDFGTPPNPLWKDPDKLYTVKVECVPYIGTASAVQQRKEGDGVSVSASPGPGVIFDGWYDMSDNLLHTSTYYSFTMPDHDVVLYARFHYDPANPASPVWPLMQYTLTPKVEPAVAASTSPSRATLYEEGTSHNVSTSANPGFVFQYWKDDNGLVVSTERSFNYLMPSHDVTLTAVYDYNPERPENPGANIWQQDLGVVYLTDFKPGELSAALNTTIGGSSNRGSVTHLVVDGEINATDVNNICNTTFRYTHIDLSGTSGVDKITSSRFKDKTTLIDLELPASISEIGASAFKGCTSLRYFSIHAAAPPVLAATAFDGVDKANLVVYVPKESVAAYKAADVWKELDIQPERNKLLQLDVLLPHECSDGRYKHMKLAVRDLTAANAQYYTVTDELRYSFAKLARNHSYCAELLTPSGSVIATTGAFTLNESGTTTKILSGFVTKHNVSLRVKTAPSLEWPEGQDITDHATVVWTTPGGSPLSVGTFVADLDEGDVLHYAVELDREMGIRYHFPAETDYTVTAADNDIIVVVQPFEHIKAAGRVRNEYLKPLEGTQVYFTQTLNGRYTVDTMVSTPAVSGDAVNIVADLYALPYHVRLSKRGYTTADDDVEQGWIDHTKDEFGRTYIDNYQLLPFQGASVTVSHTYSSDVFGGHESFLSQPYYPDLNDLVYTAVNASTGQSASVECVHPVLKIVGVLPGEQVEITCKSLSGKFAPCTVASTIDAKGFANANFNVVANPTVHFQYGVSYNPKTVAILYDAATGKLCKKVKFDSKASGEGPAQANNVYMEFTPTGQYRAVIMGESDYYNSIASYPEFATLGLQEGVDFYSELISVQAGKVCRVKAIKVPTFDESKFYYTGDNTNFVVDRPNAIVENIFKLTARVDFKEKFLGKVTDVKLVVDLPADNDFIAGSVMVGESVSPYDLTGRRLTVPLGANYTDAVRFCLRPTVRGNFVPTAYVAFDYDDGAAVKTVTQPIGSATYTASDITIWSEPLVSTPELFVDGNAPGFSTVEVYDGDHFLGSTTAIASGYWSLATRLQQPRNLSVHPIRAVAKTTEGRQLESEVVGVEYNTAAVQAKDVTMTFFNNAANKTVWLNWDLEHGTASQKNYEFAPAKDFIFVANLTNNDPKVVDEVYVRVFTHTHEWVELKANYVEGMERWVANGAFGWSAMPIGVRTRVVTNLSAVVSDEAIPAPVVIEDVITYLDEPIKVTDEPNDYYCTDYTVNVSDNPPMWGQNDFYFTLTTDADGGDNVYQIGYGRDGTYYVVNPDGSMLSFGPVADAGSRRRVGEGGVEPRPQGSNKGRIATEIVAELKHHLNVLSDRILQSDKAINNAIAALNAKIAATSDEALKAKYTALLEFYTEQAYKIPSAYATLMGYGHYAIEDVNAWQRFIDRLQPCTGLDDAQALSTKLRGIEYMNTYAESYIAAIQTVNIAAHLYDNAGFWKLDLTDEDADYLKLVATLNDYVVSVCTEGFKATKVESRNRIRKEKRDRNMFDCNYTTMEEIDDKWEDDVPYPVITPIIDPSGYVYEAVPSNRIEGVTTTVYYKRYYTNDMGDEVYEECLWDAAEYGQRNPLLTDAEGKYAWDVPAGEWRVKYEKEGFRTAYSEWLPVPPPQLDVNVGLFQNSQPFVHDVKAYRANGEYKGGIDLTFDKYMDPATLTAESFKLVGLTANDSDGYDETPLAPATIVLNDAEADLSGEHTYVRSITLLVDDFDAYDRVGLTIDKLVESYAGVHMLDDYQQTFAVTEKVREFSVDAEVIIPLVETTTPLAVVALPLEAAAGQHLTATVESSSILGLLADAVTDADLENPLPEAAPTLDVVYDAHGQAVVNLKAAMLGETRLFITDPESSTKTQVLVRVVDPLYLEDVEAPTSSVATGSTVFQGTMITLASKTPEATIYYTTDGTCPCDAEGTRQLYNGHGIILTADGVGAAAPLQRGDVVTIKAMAVNVVGTESEVAEFTYTVANTSDVFADVDDDGDLDLDDLTLLKAMLLGTAERTVLGDVNRDGTISIADVATLIHLLPTE